MTEKVRKEVNDKKVRKAVNDRQGQDRSEWQRR